MVGAAFASAATDVDQNIGSYKWFSNGEPNVSIVVGSNAAVSDAVAAANLAAMIGNLAYSDQAVTGSATGGVAGNSTAPSGTVSGKSVSLEVNSPAGATGIAGQTAITSQLYDYLDVKQAVSGVDRSNKASSVIVGDGVSTGGYKIVQPITTITNLGTYTTNEQDAYYVAGQDYYDQNKGTVVGDQLQITEVINFTGQGIPMMVDSGNGSYANRDPTDAYFTDNRQIPIHFLGNNYLITQFSNTSASAISLQLGQNSIIQQMTSGATVGIGGMQVKLISISPIGTGSNSMPQASFQLLDNNSNPIDQFTLYQGSSDYNQHGVVVHVQNVFVGSADTSYAKVAIYASAITLSSTSSTITFNDQTVQRQNANAGWTATVGTGTLNDNGYVQPTLQSIQLSGYTSNQVLPGQGWTIIANPAYAQLTFNGIDTTVPTDNLQITAAGTQGEVINASTTGDTSRSGRSLMMNLTTVTSSYTGNAFDVQNGAQQVDTLFIDKNNGRIYYKNPSAANTDPSNLTVQGVEGNVVTYDYPSTKLVNAIQLYTTGVRTAPTATVATAAAGVAGWANTDNVTGLKIEVTAVDQAGGETIPTANVTIGNEGVANLTGTAMPGAAYYMAYLNLANGNILGYNISTTTFAGAQVLMGLKNFTIPSGTDASLNGVQSAKLKVYEPDTTNQPTNESGYFTFDLNVTDPSYMLAGSGYSGNTLTTPFTSTVGGPRSATGSWQQGFISPYGTTLTRLSISGIALSYPQKIVSALWSFGAPTNVTTNTSTGSIVTESGPLSEGQVYQIGNGYTVAVKSIGASAQCTGGSAGSMTGAVASCTPSTAAVVTKLNTATTPLVYLDSAATGSGQWVIVGGPAVNTVAASTPGSNAVTQAGSSVVRILGNNVLVAGYTASDTTDAVNALIGWLASNRDTIRS